MLVPLSLQNQFSRRLQSPKILPRNDILTSGYFSDSSDVGYRIHSLRGLIVTPVEARRYRFQIRALWRIENEDLLPILEIWRGTCFRRRENVEDVVLSLLYVRMAFRRDSGARPNTTCISIR